MYTWRDMKHRAATETETWTALRRLTPPSRLTSLARRVIMSAEAPVRARAANPANSPRPSGPFKVALG